MARSFGATLVVLLTIVMTMMLIRTLGQAASGAVSPAHVVLLLGYTMLGYLPIILTLSLFIAVVSALSRMYRDSEMTVWFASGVSLGRFVQPTLRLAGPVLLAIALLSLLVWPWANQNNAELRALYERRSDLSRVEPGQFQTSSDGRRVFFIERNTDSGRTGRNVFVLVRDGLTESVTSASEGRILIEGEDRFLELLDGQRVDFNLDSGEKRIARFERYRVLAGERVDPRTTTLPPKAQSTIALWLDPTERHLGELVWRIGLPLTAVNLLLLGIGLSSTNPRRGSSWNLLFALLAFIVYYNMHNLSQAWVATGKLAPLQALAAVHGTAAALAVILLRWRQGGLHALLPLPRRTAA
jgi:lipopolysaccharide export system permease protein